VVGAVAERARSPLGFLLMKEAVEVDEDHVLVLRVEYSGPRQLWLQVDWPPLACARMPNPSNLRSAPLARPIRRYGSLGRDVVFHRLSRWVKCGRCRLERLPATGRWGRAHWAAASPANSPRGACSSPRRPAPTRTSRPARTAAAPRRSADRSPNSARRRAATDPYRRRDGSSSGGDRTRSDGPAPSAIDAPSHRSRPKVVERVIDVVAEISGRHRVNNKRDDLTTPRYDGQSIANHSSYGASQSSSEPLLGP
jgi:hypothetical protein